MRRPPSGFPLTPVRAGLSPSLDAPVRVNPLRELLILIVANTHARRCIEEHALGVLVTVLPARLVGAGKLDELDDLTARLVLIDEGVSSLDVLKLTDLLC